MKQFRSIYRSVVAGLALAALFIGLSPIVRAGDTSAPGSTTPKPYPLTNCVVSGEKLGGEMGAPVEYVYQDQQIKFCCAMCKPKFLKDPDTYMKKIKEAAAKN